MRSTWLVTYKRASVRLNNAAAVNTDKVIDRKTNRQTGRQTKAHKGYLKITLKKKIQTVQNNVHGFEICLFIKKTNIQIPQSQRVGLSQLIERRTCDGKVASSNPSRSGRRFFLSRVNFVCWLSFGVHSTPVLPQQHIKKPSHSAKSAGGRLHLNTRTPLTQQSRSGLTMPLSRHSMGTYQETSSHATCQGTFGHSCLSSLSHCGLILA